MGLLMSTAMRQAIELMTGLCRGWGADKSKCLYLNAWSLGSNLRELELLVQKARPEIRGMTNTVDQRS